MKQQSYTVHSQRCLIKAGVSGEDQPLLPLIGEGEIISIPQLGSMVEHPSVCCYSAWLWNLFFPPL